MAQEEKRKYPTIQEIDGKKIACVWGVPCGETGGLTIMEFEDAVEFLGSNDPMSMIAMQLPVDVWEEIESLDSEKYLNGEIDGINLKDEYFLDYLGKVLI